MAEQFPQSQFLGIDGSARQIEDGNRLLRELAMPNVELRHQNIMEFDAAPGEFDYIICHGVYSWVPDHVQQRILEICKRNLAPRGIAYVSYNTFPGWHMRGMIRDIMRYRAQSFEAPETQLAQARGLLTFLSNSVKSEDNAYGILLRTELAAIERSDDSYLLHDHLEEVNQPLYFYQFAEKIETAGLQYLGEADYGVMSLDNFPEHIKAMLQSVSRNTMEAEQYMDFLRNRAFRQTLLCHRDLVLDRSSRPQQLINMRVASSARPDGDVNIQSGNQVVFRRGNSVLTTTDPVVKAAVVHLRNVWPQSVPFVELASIARSAVNIRTAAVNVDVMSPDTEALAETLLRCFATSQIDLHVASPSFVTTISERPRASPLAKLQAKTSAIVTNRLHESLSLDDLLRQILSGLNGTRDKTELTKYLYNEVENGNLVIYENGRRLSSTEDVCKFLDQTLDGVLENLSRMALLVE
jgi:methyltransferase-like protein/SAM-dependent methyltransferase